MRSLAMLGMTLVVLSSAAPAQQIPVQAGITLDRDTVTVGQVLRLTVRVRAPLGATVNFPAAVDSLGPVQSLAPPSVRNGSDSAASADRVATYDMSAWDVGRQPIILGEVLVQTDDGERRVALTLPSVFVRSVLPADSSLRVPKPARPIFAVRAPTPWWWWALGVLAAVIGGAVAWWLMRRHKRGDTSTGDPFADANASFERIERLRLVDAGEPGRHAALMADVVRRYLSERIAGASLAQTSRELIATVRGRATVPTDKLGALLDSVEPVKFAAAPIDQESARAIGESAKSIVREEHERAEVLAHAEATSAERAA